MEDDVFLMDEKTCPRCAGKVGVDFDCPGYPKGDNVMVCMPSCGNTVIFECTDEDCTWWWSPDYNRKGKERMANHPGWPEEIVKRYY